MITNERQQELLDQCLSERIYQPTHQRLVRKLVEPRLDLLYESVKDLKSEHAAKKRIGESVDYVMKKEGLTDLDRPPREPGYENERIKVKSLARKPIGPNARKQAATSSDEGKSEEGKESPRKIYYRRLTR
jgi:hypothetical protein